MEKRRDLIGNSQHTGIPNQSREASTRMVQPTTLLILSSGKRVGIRGHTRNLSRDLKTLSDKRNRYTKKSVHLKREITGRL
jgi:hypothetical protein